MSDPVHEPLVSRTVEYPVRVDLAMLPTRVHKLPTLSRELGLDIWVKRDDETGSELSGNKVRKLEFLLAEARARDSDVVLTCGGIQSNHCRATTVAARRLGMDTVLFLRGDSPRGAGGSSPPEGNLFLNGLLGAETRFITSEQYEDRDALMAEAAEQLSRAGRRPYVVPEGGSNALGSFGYLRMVEELITQAGEDATGSPSDASRTLPWKHIVCATGSGGTLAGLLLGKRVFGLSTEMWGVNVALDAPHFQDRVASIASSFLQSYGSKCVRQVGTNVVLPSEVNILDGYVGPGYARTYDEEVQLIRKLARTDGLLLDPVYTGKGLYGLICEARAGRFDRGPVLFIHTGGIFSLFSYRSELWADN